MTEVGTLDGCQCVVGPLDAEGHVQRASHDDPWLLCGRAPAKRLPHCMGGGVAFVALCGEHEHLVDAAKGLQRAAEVLGLVEEPGAWCACLAKGRSVTWLNLDSALLFGLSPKPGERGPWCFRCGLPRAEGAP